MTVGVHDRARRSLELEDLGPLVERVLAHLSDHRRELDDLNVFPVPDSDTGSNLVATVRSALDAYDGERPATLASGAVRGARGNSGVIMSQVLRALAEAFDSHDEVRAVHLVEVVHRARDLAYEAVADPVQGTMLTILDAACDATRTVDAADDDVLVPLVGAMATAVSAAVLATTGQLEALARAGVVDAGARGLEVAVGAVHAHVAGAPPRLASVSVPRQDAVGGPPLAPTYRFEVQYVVDGDRDAAAELRSSLEGLGDSIVVVADGGVLKAHVHTNEVDAAIDAGRRHAEPSAIEVTDFREQGPAAPFGVVAIVPCEDLAAVVRAQGAVALVVDGDDPTPAALLEAIGEAGGRRVVVLPGRPDLVEVARTAAEVSRAEGGRPVAVVEEVDHACRLLAAVALALPVPDADVDLDDVLATMAHAAGDVRCADVLGQGDDAWVARIGDEPVTPHDDPVSALGEAAGALADGAEVATLLVADGVDDDERARALSTVVRVLDGAEVTEAAAGRHGARYQLGVE